MKENELIVGEVIEDVSPESRIGVKETIDQGEVLRETLFGATSPTRSFAGRLL